MSYNIADIRELLDAAFSDEEFDQFCYYHFRPAYEEFSSQVGRWRKIQSLISYCEKHNLFEDLLNRVQRVNPKQYHRFIPSDDRETLRHNLQVAYAVLEALEKQAAGYTLLNMPALLKTQLEKQYKEIGSLKNRLAQLDVNMSDIIPDNLYLPPSMFVGRSEELKRSLEALTPDERGWGIVLDGAAGLGKTALALKIAQEARKRAWFDAYLIASARTIRLAPEGVAHETLAPSSLDAFIREFARLMGTTYILRIPDAAERRSAFLDALRGRRTLLIWDNLESLTRDERSQIGDFLRILPVPNKVLLTNRHRVGDTAFTIRLDRLIHLEGLAEEESLELMTQISRRYAYMSDELVRREKELCIELHQAAAGNPMAIHWTMGLVAQKTHTLHEAVEQLQQAASSKILYATLFTTAMKTLDVHDHAILTALAAFQTPTRPAVLTDATGLDASDVRLSLEHLRTIGLVSDMRGGHYGVHAISRAYVGTILGWDRDNELLQSSLQQVELDPVAHLKALQYWVDHAETQGGEQKDDSPTFNALADAWPDLEAAAAGLYHLALSDEHQHQHEASQMLNDLAVALRSFLRFRGYWDEWKKLSEWVYTIALMLQDWRSAGWRAYDIAFIHWNRAETNDAALWATRMSDAMEQGGNRRDRAIATRLCGLVSEQRGDLKEAERLYLQALTVAREFGEESDAASILNDLGEICKLRRELDSADSYYRQAFDIAEKISDKEAQAIYAGNLGLVLLARNQLADARHWYELQLDITRQLEKPDLIAQAQIGLARVLEKGGRYKDALPLAEEALRTRIALRHQGLEGTRELVARLRAKVGEVAQQGA